MKSNGKSAIWLPFFYVGNFDFIKLWFNPYEIDFNLLLLQSDK